MQPGSYAMRYMPACAASALVSLQCALFARCLGMQRTRHARGALDWAQCGRGVPSVGDPPQRYVPFRIVPFRRLEMPEAVGAAGPACQALRAVRAL